MLFSLGLIWEVRAEGTLFLIVKIACRRMAGMMVPAVDVERAFAVRTCPLSLATSEVSFSTGERARSCVLYIVPVILSRLDALWGCSGDSVYIY